MEKRKNLYNLIMAAAILVILFAGVMIAGSLRGWFGGKETVVTGADGNSRVVEILVESKRGNGNLVRKGVSLALEKDVSLEDGDCIETRHGAFATIRSGKNKVYLDEESRAEVEVTQEGIVRLHLSEGGIFAVIAEPFELELLGTRIRAEDAVFSASAPYGSAGLHVLEKSVAVADREAEAGQSVSILKSSSEDGEGEILITDLSVRSLNSFELACAALVEDRLFCFARTELEELADQRQAETGFTSETEENAGFAAENGAKTEENAGFAAGDSRGIGSSSEGNVGGGTGIGSNTGGSTGGGAGTGGSTGGGAGTEGSIGGGTGAGGNVGGSTGTGGTAGGGAGTGGSTGGSAGTGGSTGGSAGTGGSTGGSAGTTGGTGTGGSSSQDKGGGSCTVSIVCDTILNNMENLAEGKDGYVPANGVILSAVTVSFSQGETVFDALKRACGSAGISLEYSWTPMYDSYYVEGINNLYEFDCGGQSGWTYKVNGWFPNYGCSSYTLSEGDVIVWCYSCTGLGEDVGGGIY